MTDQSRTPDEPTAADVIAMWSGLFEDPVLGTQVPLMLGIIRGWDADAIRGAIGKLDRMEGIGPLLDPSAFVRTPRAFDNLRDKKDALEALLGLMRTLQGEAKR